VKQKIGAKLTTTLRGEGVKKKGFDIRFGRRAKRKSGKFKAQNFLKNFGKKRFCPSSWKKKLLASTPMQSLCFYSMDFSSFWGVAEEFPYSPSHLEHFLKADI